MNDLEKKLIDAYATLVMGGKIDISEVPDKPILIEGGEESTMRAEVDAEVARRIIEKLNQPEPELEPTEIEILKIENEKLKERLILTEQMVAETSITQQNLIELLIEMEVI